MVMHRLLIFPVAPGVPSLSPGLLMPSLSHTHLGRSGAPSYAGLPLTSHHTCPQLLSEVPAHDVHVLGVHVWVHTSCTLTLRIQSWHTIWLSTPHLLTPLHALSGMPMITRAHLDHPPSHPQEPASVLGTAPILGLMWPVSASQVPLLTCPKGTLVWLRQAPSPPHT